MCGVRASIVVRRHRWHVLGFVQMCGAWLVDSILRFFLCAFARIASLEVMASTQRTGKGLNNVAEMLFDGQRLANILLTFPSYASTHLKKKLCKYAFMYTTSHECSRMHYLYTFSDKIQGRVAALPCPMGSSAGDSIVDYLAIQTRRKSLWCIIST